MRLGPQCAGVTVLEPLIGGVYGKETRSLRVLPSEEIHAALMD